MSALKTAFTTCGGFPRSLCGGGSLGCGGFTKRLGKGDSNRLLTLAAIKRVAGVAWKGLVNC